MRQEHDTINSQVENKYTNSTMIIYTQAVETKGDKGFKLILPIISQFIIQKVVHRFISQQVVNLSDHDRDSVTTASAKPQAIEPGAIRECERLTAEKRFKPFNIVRGISTFREISVKTTTSYTHKGEGP
jgi:hypothetical protein